MERFNEILELLHSRYLPEAELIVKDNIVFLCLAAFIIVMVWLGKQRGFIDRILSLGSVVVTLIAEITLFPHIMKYLGENEAIREFCLNTMQGFMHIDKESPASPLYDLLGLDTFAENAAELMETVAAKLIVFVLLFIVMRIIIRLLSAFANGLKKIELIDSIDRMLGMIAGFIEAVILIWIFMLVISGFPNNAFCGFVLKQIEHNPLLLTIYNQNLLFLFVQDILG